jgi:hypothetical protein
MSLISNGWGLGSAPANAAFPRYAYMRLLSLSVADREVEVEAVERRGMTFHRVIGRTGTSRKP